MIVINNMVIEGPIVPVTADNIRFYFDDTQTRMCYSGNPLIEPVSKKVICFGFGFVGMGLTRTDGEGYILFAEKVKLYERFKKAIESLVAFNRVEIRNETCKSARIYARPIWDSRIPYGISAKCMNADLLKIGF